MQKIHRSVMSTGRAWGATIAELDALTAEIHWHMDKRSATIEEARRALRGIRRRLKQKMLRIGPVKGDHP